MSTAPLLIHGLTRERLELECRRLGQPAFRVQQLWHWLYVGKASTWGAMRNLPAAFRTQLTGRFSLDAVTTRETREDSQDRGTIKLLLALRDRHCVEAVIIPAAHRRTVCISSQVGCKFNCAFCASGKSGFTRDLEAGEMVGQALAAAARLKANPTHVVFMGIGEPLDNVEAVLAAVRILNDPEGLKIGARRITISTCGIIPGIRRLAAEGLQVELSVSLHAPNDVLRSTLMPVSRRYALEPLLEACRDYVEHTGRIITFEYTPIRGVNDSRAQAEQLADLLKDLPCRVNLIPLSPLPEYEHQPSPPETARLFMRSLEHRHINATLRASKGAGVNAACGQLRRSRLDDPERRPAGA
ncbi:MAG: 23S rRNA (adenine(2503)-C(2))-methyltransferase RlmN, partial [Lentisphaerae bacterium]|nr:23S rRNA (adenine(2503)-C(2))-methyltransferase RlmN [Lentisphaerota bacterium]